MIVRIGELPSCKHIFQDREKASAFMMRVSWFLAMRSGNIARLGAGWAGIIDAMISIVPSGWILG